MLPSLPSTLRAGDTLANTFSISEYPAPAWGLSFTLINASAKQTIVCAASGADHALSVASATTAGYAAGAYSWLSHVTGPGGARYTLSSGSVEVLPNLAAVSTFDSRSASRKALDAVESALSTYGAKAYLQSVNIGDRAQSFRSPSEFMAFRDRLRLEVQREENSERMRQGLMPKNRLLVRFTR